jgi:hypothetical protein
MVERPDVPSGHDQDVDGAGHVYFLASAQTTLQLGARPEFRGRVLSMWSLLTAGTTPVGADEAAT